MTRLKNPLVWFWSLLAAVIGGAATAGTSWLGMAAAKAAGMDVPVLNFNALGVICLSGGVTAALGYLKQSPLPQIVEEETTIIKKDP
jgi:hypothetical protein